MCSQTKDKTTPVSTETSLLGCADWINITSDWLVAVYFLRANQRHLSRPQMQRSSISALLLPLRIPFLHPDKKSQSIRQLSFSFFLPPSRNLWWFIGEHHRVEFYLTRQVSRQNDPDARYNPDQQLLSAPPGPCSLIFMMPANN